jgi:hypothetical protein
MRFLCASLLVCAGVAYAGSTPEDPAVVQAKAGIEKLRALVEAGAAPRAQLEKAEEAIKDAEDAAFLRRTLYGTELTDGQSEEMTAVAARRLERRKNALAEARGLVEAGVATQLSLGTFLEALDAARKEHDLAVHRARLLHELTEMARKEHELQEAMEHAASDAAALAERFDGGVFSMQDFFRIDRAFQRSFGKPLPVSAMGETAVHRAMGFDHSGRVDVAVHPDKPEGVWLRDYLTSHGIPFFAFRQAVKGKATGAHIHIGPMSTRIAKGG